MKPFNQWDQMEIMCRCCKKPFHGNSFRKVCDICRLENARASSRKYNKNNPHNSTRKRMIRNREFIRDYKKDKKCSLCSYDKYPGILDFHHKVRSKSNKSVNILMKTLKSIDIIQKEIDKCILVCPNCHRELHLKEGLWS